MRVLGWLVALLGLPLCGFLMTQVEMPVRHANVAPPVQDPVEVKQYIPAYQIECGEAIGPDLREKTKVDKALFVLPADCESGIIMFPRNISGVSVDSSAPITGNWYEHSTGDGKEGILNYPKAPFVNSKDGGKDSFTWGIPVGMDVKNPQHEAVTVTVKFQH
jgi:hypothetical protein